MPRRLLVIGAHSADFVWRAGGAIAVCTQAGGTAEVIALSYGERGESGELWKAGGPDDRQRQADPPRRGRARRRRTWARRFRALDLGDYPLEIDGEALLLIADAIREFAPDVIVTHTDTDPFNPDHPVAFRAVDRARSLAAGAGVSQRVRDDQAAAVLPVRAPPARAVQLHADDVRRHHERDRAQAEGDGGDAGAEVPADLLPRARRPSRQPRAARVSGNQDMRQAEAFQRVIPQVVEQL